VRFSDGTRRVVKLSEITGMEGDTIVMQDIFLFQQTGVDGDGKVLGQFNATGVRPRFVERIAAYGLSLPAGMF